MKTGHKYITLDDTSKKKPYRVKVVQAGKCVHVGRYKTIEEAIEARDNRLKKNILSEDIPVKSLKREDIPW